MRLSLQRPAAVADEHRRARRWGATGRIRAVERRMGDLVEIAGQSVTRQIDLARRVDSLEDRVDALERE